MKYFIIFFLVMIISINCNKNINKYQIQNQKSYSEKYIVQIPIIQKLNIKNEKIHWWTIIIKDENGKELYRNPDNDFIGYLNIYWCWDKNDNLWVYNSDNDCTYFWRYKYKKWKKILWGRGNNKETKILIERPEKIKSKNLYK